MICFFLFFFLVRLGHGSWCHSKERSTLRPAAAKNENTILRMSVGEHHDVISSNSQVFVVHSTQSRLVEAWAVSHPKNLKTSTEWNQQCHASEWYKYFSLKIKPVFFYFSVLIFGTIKKKEKDLLIKKIYFLWVPTWFFWSCVC